MSPSTSDYISRNVNTSRYLKKKNKTEFCTILLTVVVVLNPSTNFSDCFCLKEAKIFPTCFPGCNFVFCFLAAQTTSLFKKITLLILHIKSCLQVLDSTNACWRKKLWFDFNVMPIHKRHKLGAKCEDAKHLPLRTAFPVISHTSAGCVQTFLLTGEAAWLDSHWWNWVREKEIW